jgi:hypothetical protein
MAKKQRRLEDLYILGREISVDDGGGDPVVVWLQKLNPMEQEKALRRANALRAQVLMARRNQESEDWQEAYSDLEDIGARDQLVEYLIADDLAKARESAEAEQSFVEEWHKDGYLQGLRDSWLDPENPLSDVYALDPEDEAARRVFLELKRFDEQVEEKLQPELKRLRKDYEELGDEELHRRAADRLMEMKAGLAWLKEFRACEVWLATRDPENHKHYYFSGRETIDTLAGEVFQQLSDAYQKLIVGVEEGKVSRSITTSSPPSEPSEKEETSPPSGLVIVSQ